VKPGVAACLAMLCVAATPTPSPSPSPRPTPNPYRQIDFASQTLGTKSSGKIQVLRGWAAVKRDGKAAVVCVSFKSLANEPATRVVFEFALAGRSGDTVGTLELDRHGTFSPGVEIAGWSSLSDWQGGLGHRGYNDNCTTIGRDVAARPLLAARYVTYEVTRVEYSDGSSWTP
jgi:hypothetical protein